MGVAVRSFKCRTCGCRTAHEKHNLILVQVAGVILHRLH